MAQETTIEECLAIERETVILIGTRGEVESGPLEETGTMTETTTDPPIHGGSALLKTITGFLFM